MKATLSIGHFDKGTRPNDLDAFFAPYHKRGGFLAQIFKRHRNKFRDDDRNLWRSFREVIGQHVTGEEVKYLQTFLHKVGFMPRSNKDGIFGYVTQASVRLFQEYIRTMEGIPCKPDGVVGKKTWAHVARWEKEGLTANWGDNTAEYDKWMDALQKTKEKLQKEPSETIKLIEQFPKESDTRKLKDWEFDKNDIHLIGIRVGEDKTNAEKNRRGDDLFVLLINGMVFKFWGSTDPNNKKSKKKAEAYLVEGQHKYSFAWHKISDGNRTYRALWPYSKPKGGVMVYRDWNKDGKFDEEDAKLRTLKGKTAIDTELNFTINIHWSGLGRSNWSEGCQVINSNKYINNKGETIDCTSFAAHFYGVKGKTKGAYNMLTDLILCYAPMGKDYLLYTIGRDEMLNSSKAFEENFLENTLKELR